MHPSGDWPVSTAQAGVTGAATNQAGISTRAPPTTERYWFTTPGHNGGSALPVWQSDCTCMAPSTCARQGRTAAFLRWCQRPTIVLKRRMTAHQYSSTWFERLRKETRGVWTCARLQCTTHFGWVNMWTKVHHVAWNSLVRIFSLAPKLSGLRRCILSQILNFHD